MRGFRTVATIYRVWWSKSKPALDEFTLDAIIRMLMQIDAKLDRLLYHLGEDDAEENDT